MFNAPAVSEKIVEDSGQKLFARDWTQENKNWFAAVQVEKKMMTLILFLIIGVAAFNLISMLVMTVNEKKYTVAILRTMGASKNSIVSIFFVLEFENFKMNVPNYIERSSIYTQIQLMYYNFIQPMYLTWTKKNLCATKRRYTLGFFLFLFDTHGQIHYV